MLNLTVGTVCANNKLEPRCSHAIRKGKYNATGVIPLCPFHLLAPDNLVLWNPRQEDLPNCPSIDLWRIAAFAELKLPSRLDGYRGHGLSRRQSASTFETLHRPRLLALPAGHCRDADPGTPRVGGRRVDCVRTGRSREILSAEKSQQEPSQRNRLQR